jgi:molybdenum cofactor cytidylyltransferase
VSDAKTVSGIAVAVLAAGRGTRLGADAAKPLLEWHGRPLVAWATDAALRSGLAPVVLVTGYRGAEVAATAPDEVTVVDNAAWHAGIASSLGAALATLAPMAEVGAVCVGLADQPRVGPDAYRRLAAAYRDGATFAVATYGGVRANPVLLARSLWDEARALTGDEGARVLMASHTVVDVPCDGTGSPADVDTYEDLGRLEGEQ